jgi:hypothetical protein
MKKRLISFRIAIVVWFVEYLTIVSEEVVFWFDVDKVDLR